MVYGLSMSNHRPILPIMLIALLTVLGTAWAADPDALWKIVSGDCGPCVLKRPDYVVMKDHHGIAQMLVIPTAKTTGIESADILAPTAPNYWKAAWAARELVQRQLSRPLPPDYVSLAINSAYGRSQNQLHIHVDCLRADGRDAHGPAGGDRHELAGLLPHARHRPLR